MAIPSFSGRQYGPDYGAFLYRGLMALPAPHRPKPGDVLICDFSLGGFRPPEMVKRRPVIVISCAQSNNRFLCTVVPLSTTETVPAPAWHHPMPHLKLPQFRETTAGIWAKVDMLATVSYERLNKPHRKTRHGRVYMDVKLEAGDLAAIRACVRAYLQV